MSVQKNQSVTSEFTSEDYMKCANPNIICIKCGIPMVEWLNHGVIPTSEYFCGMCGICIHDDGTKHQLPLNQVTERRN